jgi:hypothetical protein
VAWGLFRQTQISVLLNRLPERLESLVASKLKTQKQHRVGFVVRPLMVSLARRMLSLMTRNVMTLVVQLIQGVVLLIKLLLR